MNTNACRSIFSEALIKLNSRVSFYIETWLMPRRNSFALPYRTGIAALVIVSCTGSLRTSLYVVTVLTTYEFKHKVISLNDGL